jgi:hypothetical protein
MQEGPARVTVGLTVTPSYRRRLAQCHLLYTPREGTKPFLISYV